MFKNMRKSKFEEAFSVIKPSKMLSIFNGKSCNCPMTEIRADGVISAFDGNTISLGSHDNECINISGFEIIKLSTEDKFIDSIYLRNKNIRSNAIAIGEKYTYFLSKHSKFFDNAKIEGVILLSSTNNSVDLFEHHLAKCGEGAFERMQCNKSHS